MSTPDTSGTPGTPDGPGGRDGPGADCFYADVNGSVACTVHCWYWPCGKSGQPPSPVPVHMGIEPGYSRDQLLEAWRDTTGGLRPLVLHRGPAGCGEHRIDARGLCWCGPERIAAQQGPR